MLLPIRTSIGPRRTPYANYFLIILNALFFFLTYGPHREFVQGTLTIVPVEHWAERFMLVPAAGNPIQYLSYAFLHGSWMHIFGNMFFLFLFGNNVNGRLGHFWYVCFYLAGAVVSALGHTALHLDSQMPTLGASGAVAAVTGAYLVLFPQTMITVLWWFLFIGTIEVPALYFIGLKLILIDNAIARYTPNVAYDAHLAGYSFGILTTLLLLATGRLGRSNYDLWAMIKRWRRRRQYLDMVAEGYEPFAPGPGRKTVEAREVPSSPDQPAAQGRVQALRQAITDWLTQRNLAAAADLYVEMMRLDNTQVLARQQLLDIANQLASDSRYVEAATAYETFLEHYAGYEYAEQVQLMLGLLYARYLHKPAAAIKYLQAALGKLADPGQLKMCREELSHLQT